MNIEIGVSIFKTLPTIKIEKGKREFAKQCTSLIENTISVNARRSQIGF